MTRGAAEAMMGRDDRILTHMARAGLFVETEPTEAAVPIPAEVQSYSGSCKRYGNLILPVFKLSIIVRKVSKCRS